MRDTFAATCSPSAWGSWDPGLLVSTLIGFGIAAAVGAIVVGVVWWVQFHA